MTTKEIINEISRLEEEKIELIDERLSDVEWLDIYNKSYDIDPCMETRDTIYDTTNRVAVYDREISKLEDRIGKLKLELELRQGRK